MSNNNDKCLNPDELVHQYYLSLYSGDLLSVKSIMTQKSYTMTLESFGLELSLKDPSFKAQLSSIEDDPSALQKVEERLSSKLISKKKSPIIAITKVEPNGSKRATVSYMEDGKGKRLYFSKHSDCWLIDYYAGRPV